MPLYFFHNQNINCYYGIVLALLAKVRKQAPDTVITTCLSTSVIVQKTLTSQKMDYKYYYSKNGVCNHPKNTSYHTDML